MDTTAERVASELQYITIHPNTLDRQRSVIQGDDTMAFQGLEGRYSTILVDPPWRFQNRTGKVAPEHRRLHRYRTMTTEEIAELPVHEICESKCHLYLWCPNALLQEGLEILSAWGFTYKTNLVWYKIRKDGGPDGRGVGFYFRNVTELVLFGVRGSMRTLAPGRSQVNIIRSRKREHSRKPDQIYDLIEQCSPGPFVELFAREHVEGWSQWGDELGSYVEPDYPAYTGAKRANGSARNVTDPDRNTLFPGRSKEADSRRHRRH